MEAQEIVAAWLKGSAELCTTKQRPGWQEITLPFSTLSNKFVRVYVRHQGATGHHILSDCGDLAQDEYGVGDDNDSPNPYLRAQELLERGNYWRITREDDAFTCRVKNPEMLTAALFDFAQFIQLAVNLAVVQGQRSQLPVYPRYLRPMRRFRFLDWLDAVTDHPVARVLKGVVAALILASVLRGCYEVAREPVARHEKAPAG